MNPEKNVKADFDFEAVFEPEDYLYFYGDSLTEERTKNELKFLENELEIDNSMKILDLACGHGRHANGLAELGYNIVGVDNNPGFLEIARKEAKNKRINVKFIQKDMRHLTYKEEFDRVFLIFSSFGYFEDDENQKVLEIIANTLKLGGLFCFDIINRDVVLKHFFPYNVIEKGNDLMIDRCSFDSETGKFCNKRIVIRNGERKDKPFFIRLYNPNEIKDLLNKTGFEIYKMYSDWDAKPFTNNSERMIIIARKEKNKNK